MTHMGETVPAHKDALKPSQKQRHQRTEEGDFTKRIPKRIILIVLSTFGNVSGTDKCTLTSVSGLMIITADRLTSSRTYLEQDKRSNLATMFGVVSF